MDLTTAYNDISKKDEVSKFLSDDNYFLSHACLIQEPNKESSWEFGFYNKQSEKITVFEASPFKKREEDEVLKKEESEVKPVDLTKVNISFDEAMQIADKELVRQGIQSVNKKIIILQTEKTMIWNMTIMTHTFNLINIKVDARSGEIIGSESYSIYDLGLQKT